MISKLEVGKWYFYEYKQIEYISRESDNYYFYNVFKENIQESTEYCIYKSDAPLRYYVEIPEHLAKLWILC